VAHMVGSIVCIAGIVTAAAPVAEHLEREVCFVDSAYMPAVVVAASAAAAALAVLAAAIAQHRTHTEQHTV